MFLMSRSNAVVAWIKCDGFQKAEALTGIASKGGGAAEFHSP